MVTASGTGRFEPVDGTGFVGRAREQQVLESLFSSMKRGEGRLILIGGEAGIGKSSLVARFTKQAAEDGAIVLTGHCYDLTATPPYGPWVDVGDRYQPAGALPALPSVLRSGADIGDISNQSVLFNIVRDFLFEIARLQPLILVLEDLHWSDPASLELLRSISRQSGSSRLLIVGTYRDDQADQTQYFFNMLPILIQESGAERIKLQRFDSEEVDKFLDRYALGERDRQALGIYLNTHGQGIPLFTRELLSALEVEGYLQHRDERWTLNDPEVVLIPNFLRHVIERRLNRLNVAARDVINAAAIIGHEVPVHVWRAVTTCTEGDFFKAVEDAYQAKILEDGGDRRNVKFTHALVRERLYESIPLPERQMLHRRAANVLIEDPLSDPDSIAYHLVNAGDNRAFEWLVTAGERAARTYAWRTAAERFFAASEQLRSSETKLRERGWLLYRSARLLRFSEQARALDLFIDAETIGVQTRDQALVAFAISDRGQILTGLNDFVDGIRAMHTGNKLIDELSLQPEAEKWIRRQIADVPAGESTESSAVDDTRIRRSFVNPRLGMLAMANATIGMFAEAARIAEPYLDDLREIGAGYDDLQSAFADASTALAISSAMIGDPDKARRCFAEAYDARRSIGHFIPVVYTAMTFLSFVHLPYSADDPDERRWYGDELEDAVRHALGAVTPGEDAATQQFNISWIEGRWHDISSRGVEAFRFNTAYIRDSAALALGRVARESGNADVAQHWVSQLLPDGHDSEPGKGVFWFCHDALALGASLALDDDSIAVAQRWIDQYHNWLSWSGAVIGRVEGLLLQARLHRLAGEPEPAFQMAEQALAQASRPRQPLSLVAAHRFMGELQTERQQFSDADEHFQASLNLAQACAARYECALTLLGLVELYNATKNNDAANLALHEAISILESLGAKPALARAQRLGRSPARPSRRERHPSGLTQREIEVVRLITQGMSDREIAEQLFISHHTVMRHVSHILAKLNVDSRAAAAAEAVRQNIA